MGPGPQGGFRRCVAIAEKVVPAWVYEQVTAEQYDSWSAEQYAGMPLTD